MQGQSKQVPGDSGSRVERLVVLLVLEHSEECSRTELDVELSDIDRQEVRDALGHLEAVGVVTIMGEHVWASRCARHLDALGMIHV